MTEGNLTFNSDKKIDDLNFYCFSDSTDGNPENLNFNNLKKCQKTDYIELSKKNKTGFLVVDFDNIVENKPTGMDKKMQYWHNQDMDLNISFLSGASNISFDATIKSILHKGFTLQTTSTS